MQTIFNWLLEKAKDYILRNWKTTLIGILGAVLSRYIPNITPDQQAAIIAAVVAALGIFSKDADKTGTTTQPRESVQPGPVYAPVPLPDPVTFEETEAERVARIQNGP